jgi:hypothetical protein
MNRLYSLEPCDRGFESHSRHECLYCVSLFCVCVVLCVGSGLEIGWSPSKESYHLCTKSRKSDQGPTKGCRVIIIIKCAMITNRERITKGEECRLFCVCVVLCVGRGLARGWSPSKESYHLCTKSRKSDQGPTKGCRVIIIKCTMITNRERITKGEGCRLF